MLPDARVQTTESPPPAADPQTPEGASTPERALPAVGSKVDQFANIAVTVLPLLLLVLAARQAWNGLLHWQDLVVLAVTYTLTGFGVTVGFHRLFTHRSFQTKPALRALFAILGSAAVEGPVIEWVAYHRRHHVFSDEEGDPHSPHVGHGSGWRGALHGLWYAHVGWVWFNAEPAEETRYAPDLMRDPLIRAIDRTFLVWALVGLAFPFGLGLALTGTLAGALTGLLWGGAVRIFVLHQFTFCINSLCHFFGRKGFETGDHSRNVAWLALPTFGEAWHNNHHAFPTSARHGLEHGQVDISAALIGALERTHLAWDVVKIGPEQRAKKAVGAPPAAPAP